MEMIEYCNDIDEMVALINSQFNSNSATSDFDSCISRITLEIDDDFLMSRAECIKNEISSNAALIIALKKLSTICNEGKTGCLSCPVKKYCNHFIFETQNAYNANAPKIIDLFCGAGGLSLGFTQEGFITALANDIEPCCIDTYSHNHPETPRKHHAYAV